MKFTIILLLLSFFRLSANYSQGSNLSLTLENTTIKSVLKEIEKQSEYTFLYDNSKINVNKEVSVSLQNEKIEDVLKDVFEGSDINYRIEGKQILLANRFEDIRTKQEITIKGKVTSLDNNEALPGVNIVIKGTTTGTITDLDGNYTLSVADANAILVYTYVGYLTEEITVGSQTELNVSLSMDIQQLSEVVVVGYGTMRKGDLTGAISSVSAEELNKGVITTTEQVLQGKVAGLTVIKGSGDPTAGATMRLRGGTSLSASSSPLVVIDGISGVDINTVQPSDIESIDVLKDASASAIYGSRGANGVIIITTKHPKSGKKIEYNGYAAWGKVANHIDMMSADDYRALAIKDPSLGIEDLGSSTDWIKAMEQTGFTQSHDLSISSGSEDGGFHASLSYLDNKGIIITSQLQRLGTSISGYTYGLNKKLRVEIGTHSTFDKFHPINTGAFELAYNQNPTMAIFDSTGAYNIVLNDTRRYTPIEILENNIQDNTTKRILGYAKAEIDFFEGLKGTLNVSEEYNSQQGRNFQPIASQQGISTSGSANRTLDDYTNTQLETYLTYTKELNSGHRFNIMAGYSYLDHTQEGFGASRQDYITNLNSYNNLGAGTFLQSGDVNSYKENSKLVAFFGRANYSYKSKYVATATLRRDGSSKFGENNKWGLFPSAAFAWRISDESFLASSSTWLNSLKIRLGYGVTGSQDAIPPYTSLSVYGTTPSGSYYNSDDDSWGKAYAVKRNPNKDLKWETSTQYNIGLDFSLFERLSGTLELYSKKTSDLIYQYKVPQPPNLYETTLANVGDLSNKGIELSLSTFLIKTSDFRWDIDVSMAMNKMLVDNLSNDLYKTDSIKMGDLIGINGMTNTTAQILYAGGAVGTFWGKECIGIDSNGFFLGVDGKVIDPKKDTLNTDLGNAQPKFTMGFSTSIKYKNFDLGISTYGLFGQKVFNATAMVLYDGTRFPSLNAPTDYLETGITDGATYSSYWIEKASFFRIQSVTLGYTFNIKNAYFERLRLYVSGENLWVFTNYKGIDPEIKIESYNGTTRKMDALLSPGIDRFDVYPKARTFSIGLNAAF